MPIILRKTPDSENRHDQATVTIQLPDGLPASELVQYMADFMRACGYASETVEEAASELINELHTKEEET